MAFDSSDTGSSPTGSGVHRDALPIPPRLDGPHFDLEMSSGIMEFLPGFTTDTKGYNGNFLGPTLFLRKGSHATFDVTSNLDIHTTTHWHGQHLPADMDGGPYQMIMPGATWNAAFEIWNSAGTYWYHPHPHPSSSPLGNDGTGGQVYDGLAGLFIIEDEASDALPLPRDYGVDDIPIILQDRSFDVDGAFLHFPLDFNAATDAALRKGDTFLVNGRIAPVLRVGAQVIRMRILNASNARVYNLAFSENTPFYQVASDGGFLQAPVELTRLLLAPGERAEILLNLNGKADETMRLRCLNANNGQDYVPNQLQDEWDRSDFDLMTIEVHGVGPDAVTEIPSVLVPVERMAANDADNADAPRQMELNVNPFNINGARMNMDVVNARILLGTTEIWELTNPNLQAHPFHVHGEPFQILTRDGELPPANEQGWKDVVFVRPNETVRIIKHFGDYADPNLPFMYHCHILEHEDLGMMGTFTVQEVV